MANIAKIQKALNPHIPKIDPSIRIPLNIYKNIPYPFHFWANIPVSLKTFQGLKEHKVCLTKYQHMAFLNYRRLYIF